MKLSLICPCYNEEENVRNFFNACTNAFKNKIESYEFIFINDGSKDNTWSRLYELYNNEAANIKIISFSRNFGKEAAMYAGLQKAEGEYTVIIDTDLQQPPEKVVEMVEFLDNNPDYDCVSAYQQKRSEGKIISYCKSVFYKFFLKFVKLISVPAPVISEHFVKMLKTPFYHSEKTTDFSKVFFRGSDLTRFIFLMLPKHVPRGKLPDLSASFANMH